MGLKQITLGTLALGIHPTTKMLQVKQGDNVISMTRDQVIGLKRLKEGQYETGIYTSQILPRNKFKLTENGPIIAQCLDENNLATVLINSKTYKAILQYTENNKGRIAWDRDFRRQ